MRTESILKLAGLLDVPVEVVQRAVENCPMDQPAAPASDADRSSSSAGGKRAVSPAKLAANRANAAKSTGPKTAAGKNRVRYNAVRHGIFAACAILPGDNVADLTALAVDLETEFGAGSSVERALARRLLSVEWKLIRLARAEEKMILGERCRDGQAMYRFRQMLEAEPSPVDQELEGPTTPDVLADDFRATGGPGRFQQLMNAEIRLNGQFSTVCRLLIKAKEKGGTGTRRFSKGGGIGANADWFAELLEQAEQQEQQESVEKANADGATVTKQAEMEPTSLRAEPVLPATDNAESRSDDGQQPPASPEAVAEPQRNLRNKATATPEVRPEPEPEHAPERAPAPVTEGAPETVIERKIVEPAGDVTPAPPAGDLQSSSVRPDHPHPANTLPSGTHPASITRPEPFVRETKLRNKATAVAPGRTPKPGHPQQPPPAPIRRYPDGTPIHPAINRWREG